MLRGCWFGQLLCLWLALAAGHEKVAKRMNIKPGEVQTDVIALQDVTCTFAFDIAGGGTSEEWELRLEEDSGYFRCSALRASGSYLLFKRWNLSVTGRKVSDVVVMDNDGKMAENVYVRSDKEVRSFTMWKGLLSEVTIMTENKKTDL
eukprot:TRINITY_DN1019_c0_g1_i1.p1 TRINITY_DN1019_c0_g1~~TRINITY_DN1019_c0_g1_i1.p1  ORF type:complete len:148 (+),score=11.45 TRINITY_DN1019_c0_g1_i1:51-494(+)